VHDAAVGFDGVQLGIAQRARVVNERPDVRVAGNHRRFRELKHLQHSSRCQLGDVDDHAERTKGLSLGIVFAASCSNRHQKYICGREHVVYYPDLYYFWRRW